MIRKLLPVPLLILGLGLGACSGADAAPGVATAGGATPTASAEAAAADDEKWRAFAACMRENGVDVPDPEPGSANGKRAIGGLANIDKDKLSAALDACRDLMPSGGNGGTLTPEQLDRQRQFAACMRENGVPDFPDPDPNGGADALREYVLDKHDGDVTAALEKCRDVALPSAAAQR